MADFALVHGAYHGAWCWDRVVAELEARGHRAVAMDLPSDQAGAGPQRYAEAVIDAAAGLGDDVVVVGHSLGGLTIPVVAAKRPTAFLVFVAAIVPQPGKNLGEVVAGDPPTPAAFMAAAVDNGDGSSSFPVEYVEEFFTHDAPADTGWVANRLRPQDWTVSNETCPLDVWPDVPSAYVVCREDRILSPDWQRRTARTLLGVEPLELDGGHEPMVSRPSELAGILDQMAVQPPSTNKV